MDDGEQNVSERLGALRIIVVLMALGIAAFTAMSQVVPFEPNASQEKLMTMITVGMGVVSFVGYFVMRMVILSSARSKFDRDDPQSAKSVSFQIYFLITLMGSALAEGFALLGIVASMITGQRLLLISAAIAVVAIALQFPTANSFARCYQSITGNPLPSSDWPR
ncbi:MAG: hypothetical protein DHS20C16_20250 [Phycisphaerae bacterium]|nr:MAG: hypothetical protein DHS20C16_20250 [Phycisphaerae bacterium]